MTHPSELPLNRDEWPSLASLEAPDRPRFPDGEPVSPLAYDNPQRWLRVRIALGALFLTGAVLFRACAGW